MQGRGGFGIVTVMAGAAVLGIFAWVYAQQMQNRTNVSLIGDLMAFREQVMTYYSSVLANRNTWECTVKSNSVLKTYVDTGYHRRINDSGGTTERKYHTAIYDYTGDCQEGFPGPTAVNLLVPEATDSCTGGLGLRFDSHHSSLPVSPVTSTDTYDSSEDGHHFGLIVGWIPLDIINQGHQRAVDVFLQLCSNRAAIKKTFGISFDLADKENHIYMNRTVAADCSDGRVTGYFPGTAFATAAVIPTTHRIALHPTSKGVSAYAGDTAIVDFNRITGAVTCSGRGPLIVPPCYDMADTSTVNPFLRVGSGMEGLSARGTFTSNHGFGGIAGGIGLTCDGTGRPPGLGTFAGYGSKRLMPRPSFKGKCPETGGGGTTAIAYFDSHTGISHCSHPNILVEKVVTDVDNNCENDDNHYGVVKIRQEYEDSEKVGTFQCSKSRWGTGKGGVQPGTGICNTSTEMALAGFDSTGKIDECIDVTAIKTAKTAPNGFRGPKGKDGNDGRWLYTESGGTYPLPTDRLGNSYAPSGDPGVGATGPPGPDRSCDLTRDCGGATSCCGTCYAC